MKNRRALVFAIGLGVFSLIILYFYVSNIEKEYVGRYEPVGVVVAKADIFQNDIIDRSMLEVRMIPKPYVQPLAVVPESVDQIIGNSAAAPIKKGEQIVKTKISTIGSQGISPIIPKGFRACTIPVNEITGVGNHIRNGDFVDIIGTFRTLTDKRAVKDLQAVTLFQNVPVLATGKNYLFDPGAQASKSKGSMLAVNSSSSGFSTVTLQVTPRTCMDLAIAQQTGTLTLMLRSFHDRFAGETNESLKTNRSTTESVTGIKEPIQIKESPQWLEQRGDQTLIVP